MNCNECGGSSKVIDTNKQTDQVKRRRKCKECGHRWTTVEHGEISKRKIIFTLISLERDRQKKKWKEQRHRPDRWALILLEEVGEAAQAFLQGRISDGITELIQAAAVIVAWLEFITH